MDGLARSGAPLVTHAGLSAGWADGAGPVTPGAVGRGVRRAAASTIVVGAPAHGGLPALMDGSATRELWRLARSNVLVINPDAPGKLVADDGYVTATPAG